VLHFKFDKAKGKLRIEEDGGRNLEMNIEQSQGE
jgi:hypothetical protein